MPEMRYKASSAAEERLRDMDYEALSRHLAEISRLPDVAGDYVELILKIMEERCPASMSLSEIDLQSAREELWEQYIGKTPGKNPKGFENRIGKGKNTAAKQTSGGQNRRLHRIARGRNLPFRGKKKSGAGSKKR